MNKNIFFFILVFLILIASATAVTLNTEKELLETTFSQPIIIVSYPEAEGTVEITNFSLIRDNISYDITYSTNDYITFNFTPNNPLNKGLYILKITAEDLVSNSITVTQPIQINAPFMKIWVDSPHLGFYSHKPFNAIIKSEFPAICKFDFTIDKPLDFNMFFSFNEGLDDYTTEHTIIDMGVGDLAFREDSPDEDGEQSLIRVECNDTYTALHMNTLYLGFDPSAPNITVELEELISDLTIPFTPLKVDTTDRSICSYEENGVTKYFGDHDLDNFSHYQKNHEIILNFTYLARLTEAQGLFIPKPFTYLISCTNLAGLPGEPVLKELEVAFERDFSIIKYKPKNFTNENNIEFIISTSVTTLGGCTYDQQNFDSNQNNQAYTKNFGALSEGFYTYDVRCLTGYSFSDEVLSFVVDRSNPSILDLNINNNPTCGNSIQAEVLVEDNFGIKDINFSIEKLDGTIIKTGSTQSGSINEIFNLNDFDNTSPNMRLNVVVSDFADNKAQRSEVVTAISSQGSLCDDERPLTNLDIATTSNGLEVNVTCTDVGTAGCSNNFEYGTSENASLCVLDISRQLGQPIIFNENSYLCWTVFDNMDNNASGLEYIEFSVYPNHCFNTEQDADEEGLNCGGSCPACIYPHCSNNVTDEDEERMDCGGADCEPCGELPNHCLNNVTDEDETGIDCGGADCEPCTELHCNNTVKDEDEERVDCGGADCEPCGELPNHCLNNVTDEDETGIDCGGIDCDPCTVLHCNNNIQDYDETGIDCGGYSCEPCNILHCNNTIKDEDEERVDCGGADCEACIELETHCTDNILNSDEEEIDCGGIDCDPCTVLHCNNSIRDYDELDVDCGGYSCEPCNETPLHCNNTILDFDEERIDCGGIDCEPCGEIELHCNNTVKDQDEERVDCGGADCEACIELETHCTDNMLNSDEEEIDCGGDDCDPCMVLHCNNTIRDYDELRVDCGGFTCEPCITPPHCNNTVRDADETGVDCGGSECIICTDVPLHCNNLIRDYDEIGIDCGGSCNSCSTGEQCESAIDCLSLNCFLGICLAPTCTDNILNQNETLIDCGGQNCDSCISEACSNGILDVFEERVDCGGNCSACPSLPSHCTNGYVDSDETDTDCGGLECVPCNADSYCDSDSDCESRQCEDNICLSESCDNDVKDGDETDIDCGGSCANCQDDDSCLEDDDCRSDNCINLICTPADADSDGDGMIDGWEDFYNFDKNDPSDAPIDSDEDGYTNLEEFIGGSNPLDPNSVPGDQDGDKMPDEWEEMYDLDKEDPLDAFEDKDGDGYTNLEEYTAGSNPTNPDSTPKSRNFIWLIFLLAGLFLIIGGVIYLYVKKQNMPDKTFSSSLSISPNQARKKSIEQKILAEEHQKELIRQKAIFEKKNQEKEQRRQSSIKGFDSDSNNKKEANAAMNDLTKSSKDKEDLGDKVLNVKSKPAKSKQTKTGFIGLDELDEELDSDDNKDEDSIFSELDSIGKEKKTSEKMKSFSKEESKKTNDSSKKEQNKSTSTKKTSKKQSTKTSKKEEKDDFEVIDVKAAATKDSNDIFKELAAISGVSHASIKKKIAEDEFDTTAIMGVFKKIKDLDGIKTETFKEIAANLLSEGHLNKDHIAEVLFHYYDKNMITKKQISDVLKELDMVKK